MHPTKFRFIWQSGFRGEDFRNLVGSIYGRSSFIPSQSVNKHGCHRQFLLEEKNLKNQPIRNKNHLWRPCLLTDWDGMNKIYRGPSIDASNPLKPLGQMNRNLVGSFLGRSFMKNAHFGPIH
jgi:hypothetical protein